MPPCKRTATRIRNIVYRKVERTRRKCWKKRQVLRVLRDEASKFNAAIRVPMSAAAKARLRARPRKALTRAQKDRRNALARRRRRGH